MNCNDIYQKALSGARLSLEEGVFLLENGELLTLGQIANVRKQRVHKEKIITFVIDRNINYTNVCTVKCKFCAFYRNQGENDAYILTDKELFHKIDETIAQGGTQLLIQGGLHPELGLNYYASLLKKIKAKYQIHIHSFSPPEIKHMALMANRPVKEILLHLKAAGLDSIPGGGAEILVDRVREKISQDKISADSWLNIMKSAHQVGFKTTATMMFGSIETLSERVEHLIKIRDIQDETQGFTAFIPWSFQPNNTYLGGVAATSVEYLKMVAISRILLDNVPNIQASWVTQGSKVAQTAMFFGANDFGGTMLEENVVRAAGVTNNVLIDEIINSIRIAGFQPAQRNTFYNILKRF
ncbi:cyclic dehypoxanthinyl futalosine synthase [Desulfitispora alkaliphila]|uniref:cyclic dehypoxanthinyl futalosine synthase n=1 Tax=Desulfitispora alkaliphila TaxID=622674 RepID=UPI003D2449A9